MTEKRKLVIVTRCSGCPHRDYDGFAYVCRHGIADWHPDMKSRGYLDPDAEAPPTWCPLPDEP